jgi:hypothetical protein
MLHAAIRWPDTADASLWPMAVDYAVHIHNHMRNRTSGLSPIDLFTRTRFPTHMCLDLRVWGCPTFVLDRRQETSMLESSVGPAMPNLLDSPKTMPLLPHWFSTWTPATSLLSFIVSLTAGLPQLLVTLLLPPRMMILFGSICLPLAGTTSSLPPDPTVDKGNCEETNEPEPSPKHGYRKTKTATTATDTPHSFETYPVSK